MRLGREDCLGRLGRAEIGVLATVHQLRGVDAVPACFVVHAGQLVVPIDRVKPKGAIRLQRGRNLDHDPRAAFLCDHWDRDDWNRLWWVRASLERTDADTVVDGRLTAQGRLREKYSQYRGEAFTELLVFRIAGITGWAASQEL